MQDLDNYSADGDMRGNFNEMSHLSREGDAANFIELLPAGHRVKTHILLVVLCSNIVGTLF